MLALSARCSRDHFGFGTSHSVSVSFLFFQLLKNITVVLERVWLFIAPTGYANVITRTPCKLDKHSTGLAATPLPHGSPSHPPLKFITLSLSDI